ncbi:CoA transferase subunit A [Chloroflexota bacterium]
MSKIFASVGEAVADIPDGASVAIGGFFTSGTPSALIKALARQGAKNLTLIVMQMGPGNEEVMDLVLPGQVKKAICNYPFYRSASRGEDSPFEIAVRAGEIELEVYPMGTFIEKLRCGGAGIPAFFTPTGVGTVVEEGKEKRSFEGREYLLETALKPDYALIHAYMGDDMGNIMFHKTAANFNPEMAKAARVAIAQVEQLVKRGTIKTDDVMLPGVFTQRLVQVDRQNYIPSID